MTELVTRLPTLLDLLSRYREENPSDCCDRLDQVIPFIQSLCDTARLAIEKRKEKFTVIDTENEMPLVVLWFETPLFFWREQTYAVFLVSFMVTFFNPQYRMEGDKNDTPSDTEAKQIQSQFGRILKYIHSESSVIAPYFDKLWQHGAYTQLDWRTTSPQKVYNRLVSVWSSALARCNKEGNDNAAKAQLFESLMNNDVTLLHKGIGVPMVLSHMLMHFYHARLNEITSSIISESNEKEEEEKACDES